MGPLLHRYFSVADAPVLPCPQLVKPSDTEEPGVPRLIVSSLWIFGAPDAHVVQGSPAVCAVLTRSEWTVKVLIY